MTWVLYLAAFKILSLFRTFNVLIIIWCGEFIFWFYLVFCMFLGHWQAFSSIRLEKYSSIILLKTCNLTFYLTEWSNSSVLSSRRDILSCILSNFWWSFPLTFFFKFLNFHFEFYFILTFLQRFCLLNSLSIFGIIFIISFSCIFAIFILSFIHILSNFLGNVYYSYF